MTCVFASFPWLEFLRGNGVEKGTGKKAGNEGGTKAGNEGGNDGGTKAGNDAGTKAKVAQRAKFFIFKFVFIYLS